jgi:hypothetical protein
MNNGKINALKYINNSIYNSINNSIINSSSQSDKTTNYLYLGIIFVLIIILIISVIILCFISKNKNKVKYVSNNIGLNKIIIKNNISPNIITWNSNKDKKSGFQRVQNTSKVNDIIQQNNVLNEIKSSNLENEIHNIIHSSSSSGSSSLGGGVDRGKRLLRKKNTNSKNRISENMENKDKILENVNINKYLTNQGNKEKSEEKTQNLEKEIKEQIKKFVIEEHNI